MATTLQFPLGSILQFTSGEYSDFGLCGTLVAIKPLNLPALAQDYTRGKDRWDAGTDGFAAWLIANGHAMPVDMNSVHLGDYGRWEPEFAVQHADD